ncbi:MAG: carbon-nitrogen hydrolase family protein [Ktedonobacterales bacterium]|nr:carbon-nitrogen hydrolase family protein [Ktedonobacterales bacterium]
MKVTVCEMPDDRVAFATAWDALVAHTRASQSDLVLLPELPFTSWFAGIPAFDANIWRDAETAHHEMLARLSDLASATVLGTYPVTSGAHHINRAFVWTPTTGAQAAHDKYYLPNEAGFYERNWFDRSERDFSLTRTGEAAIGFLICTELMFNEWARAYGKQGANIIAVPRATTLDYEHWVIAPRMAAYVSGAFVLSSNRVAPGSFCGCGVVVGPDGSVLAATSRQQPFVTVEIALAESALAKTTYPRDVFE